MCNYSSNYYKAIATLAQKIYESHLLKDVILDLSPQSLIWDEAVKIKPKLRDLAIKTESELEYGLSFNQCCNAVVWNFRFKPEDWSVHL